MSIEFRMPSLGPDMEAGTLVEWRIKPGDTVKRGDIVALVETDKGIIDVEIFADGKVESLSVEQGAHVPVGSVLALLSGAAPSAATGVAPTIEAPFKAPESPSDVSKPAAAEPTTHRTRVSPAARIRAQALGIDLAMIAGSGPRGVVTLEDVEATARFDANSTAASSAAPRPHTPDMRQIIAKAMARSKREIPHYYLTLACSFDAARRWLDRHNASVGIEERILPAALLVKSVALTARALPDFNGHYQNEFSPALRVNVGVAIAMRGGRLVAPAILEADTKSLPTIMQEMRDLSARVRAGHMRGTELTHATITVTSLAEDGPDTVVPIIHPPQVAMVAFGSIAMRPVVIDAAVKAALTVDVTLAADHRVTDGRAGARFIASIRDLLEKPERL